MVVVVMSIQTFVVVDSTKGAVVGTSEGAVLGAGDEGAPVGVVVVDVDGLTVGDCDDGDTLGGVEGDLFVHEDTTQRNMIQLYIYSICTYIMHKHRGCQRGLQ